MSTSLWLFCALVAAVAVERLVEMRIAKRHAERLVARGGYPAGDAHFPWMVALHTALLVAAPLEAVALDRSFIPWLGWPMLAAVALTMALRYWVIASLGDRWTTRVFVVPDEAPVTGGPYRFLRHPNYLAVIVEVAALPLVHGAWLTALVFSALNAWLLTVRIRVEEKALESASRYDDALGSKPRLIPAAKVQP
ncbi:MAG: isoprenylcysteine carboxyl methyltransferase family protein [Acidobacteriota bacterium]